MIHVILEGRPYDRGLEHGRLFAESIRIRAEEMWLSLAGDGLRPAIGSAADFIGSRFPEINEEIRGIAAGSGISFEQAFLANNRCVAAPAAEGCTNIAVSRGGRVIAGMNKDMPDPDASTYFVKTTAPHSGHRSVSYCQIGRVWGYGVNGAGLCMAGTSAEPLDNTASVPSIGLYLVSPIVMPRCGSVKEALELMMSIEPISESGNILLADASGEAAVVEVSPGKRVIRKPVDGAIYSTNFYASGEIPHASSAEHIAESEARYASIGRQLSGQKTASAELVKSVLSSHAPEGPVCRHNSIGLSTVLSWVAEPQERRFHVRGGAACGGEYQQYSLDG